MKVLPDNILKAIPASERKRLGKAAMTREQAEAAFEARSERDLQRLINSELCRRQANGELYFNTARMDKRPTCKKGWADFAVLKPQGRLLLLEVKFGSGKLSSEQSSLQAMCLLLGHRYVVVTTFQSALEAIKE